MPKELPGTVSGLAFLGWRRRVEKRNCSKSRIGARCTDHLGRSFDQLGKARREMAVARRTANPGHGSDLAQLPEDFESGCAAISGDNRIRSSPVGNPRRKGIGGRTGPLHCGSMCQEKLLWPVSARGQPRRNSLADRNDVPSRSASRPDVDCRGWVAGLWANSGRHFGSTLRPVPCRLPQMAGKLFPAGNWGLSQPANVRRDSPILHQLAGARQTRRPPACFPAKSGQRPPSTVFGNRKPIAPLFLSRRIGGPSAVYPCRRAVSAAPSKRHPCTPNRTHDGMDSPYAARGLLVGKRPLTGRFPLDANAAPRFCPRAVFHPRSRVDELSSWHHPAFNAFPPAFPTRSGPPYSGPGTGSSLADLSPPADSPSGVCLIVSPKSTLISP